MCGGGREEHDIKEAERMDQEEQKKNETSTNIHTKLDSLIERYYQIARWHGSLQAQFYREMGMLDN